MVHRHLARVWNREANGSRLMLLDTPLADELPLYDLNPGRREADSGVEGFDDPRSSWAEAAPAVSVAQPEVFGVCRKVKRLAARITGSSPETGGSRGTAGRRLMEGSEPDDAPFHPTTSFREVAQAYAAN
ncbi:hypothetical protein [Streptomyces sp. NPDC057199]|uniref:hypothetical protein n=1 Tax=Streptomyces sp. NPDC057199 TaxID=3346047 RepID=UPI0036423950